MELLRPNLNYYNIPEEAQLVVTLIIEDLRVRKLMNGLTHIGCDGSYLLPDLSNLILALVGFNDR